MKTFLVLALTLSLCAGFNFAKCEADLKGLLISFTRAVVDWNMVINFRQAIQETGYAVQFLGAALIDCDPLPSGLFAPEVFQVAGEELAGYDGTESFEPLVDYVSEGNCEEKLEVLTENLRFYLESKSGESFVLQSLHDFMATCQQAFRVYF